MPQPQITRSPASSPPALAAIEEIFRSEAISPSPWSNGPGHRYAAHSHPYHKVLYCVRGSITFALTDGEQLELAPGDRLDIPPATEHSAIVGPHGVTCIEAARA